MTIQRNTRMPFDLPSRDTTPAEFVDALEAALDNLAKTSQETQVANIITGCDGLPIVTVGDGSTCHDAAKPGSGGKQGLVANVGGQRVAISAKLGRGMSASTGYSGHGLTSGAIPTYYDRQANALSMEPADNTTTTTLSLTDSGDDPLNAIIGATISGKTGDSKRLAICYGSNGAGVFDDVLSGTETAITGISINPEYIGAMGSDMYALTELYENTVSLTAAGAETATTDLPVYTGGGPGDDFAYSAVAFTRDLDTMAVIVRGAHSGSPLAGKAGIYIGTSMLTAPSWAVLDLDIWCNFQVYGTRSLVFDDSGVLWIACQSLEVIPRALILLVSPPYTSVTQTANTSAGVPISFTDPVPVAISRDGRYIATGIDDGTNLLDIWAPAHANTIPIPTGYTNAMGYGGLAWGPDGRLFALLQKVADSMYHLAVWTTPFGSPELIDLGTTARHGIGWLSVSGDGQAVATDARSTALAAEIYVVEPPYTAAGATVTPVTIAYQDWTYQFEFDPSEAYADATGLTLDCTVTSTTGSGSAVTVVTKLAYANTSGVAAFGVIIEMTLPDGSTFTSATDDGIYDSEAGIIRWLIPSVAASATGYVEITSTVG